MLDADVVELCAQCLAEAAAHDAMNGDLVLSATALARDLGDVYPADAVALLDAASRRAMSCLERSCLDNHSFRAALCRLASLRADVCARLVLTTAF